MREQFIVGYMRVRYVDTAFGNWDSISSISIDIDDIPKGCTKIFFTVKNER